MKHHMSYDFNCIPVSRRIAEKIWRGIHLSTLWRSAFVDYFVTSFPMFEAKLQHVKYTLDDEETV